MNEAAQNLRDLMFYKLFLIINSMGKVELARYCLQPDDSEAFVYTDNVICETKERIIRTIPFSDVEKLDGKIIESETVVYIYLKSGEVLTLQLLKVVIN